MKSAFELPVIGRASELIEFDALLTRGYGVLAYYGHGGVGKTRLLKLFQERASEQGVVLYIDAYGRSDVLALVADILRSVQSNSTTTGSLLAKLESSIQHELGRLDQLAQITQSVEAKQGSTILGISQYVDISEAHVRTVRRQVVPIVSI